MATGSAPLVRRISVLVAAAAALLAVVLPQPAARGQVADWVDIPVSVSPAAGVYFVVVTSADGTIEALRGETTRSFGYPAAAPCDGRTGDCFTSVVAGIGAIGFEGTNVEIAAALASLRFRVRDGVALGDAKITVNISANPDPSRSLFFNPDNGHYYEFVTDTVNYVRVDGGAVVRSAPTGTEDVQTTWEAAEMLARSDAQRLSVAGTLVRGYLATITSLSESAFTNDFVDAANVWIGASDEFSVINAATGVTTYADQNAAEGNWYWVTGPEAGTHFWQPGTAGQRKGVANEGTPVLDGATPPQPRFNAWKNGTEPNNSSPGEHFAILNFNCGTPSTCTATSNWNDFSGTNEQVKSFLVEFGPFADDVTAALATEVEFNIVDLIPVAAPVSTLAMSCSPDPVVAGGTVTCEVTGGDPNIDILWRASIDGVIASQGVRLDANGNGTFTFVAPAGSSGRSIAVELVEWNVGTAVGVTGRVLPSAIRAGGGPLDSPAALLLGSGLLLGALLTSRLRVRRPSEG